MRSKLAMLLSLVLALSMFGASPVMAETEMDMAADETMVYAVDGDVILDAEGVKVTTAGLDYDYGEWALRFHTENTGSEDVYLTTGGVAANGYMTDVYLAIGDQYNVSYEFDLLLEAGSEGDYWVAINQQDLDVAGIDEVTEVSLVLGLKKDMFETPFYVTDIITVCAEDATAEEPTEEPAEEPAEETMEPAEETMEEPAEMPADEAGTVIVDDDLAKIVVLDQDFDDFYGPIIYVSVTNKSDQGFIVNVNDVKLDGMDNYGLLSYFVLPGMTSKDMVIFDVNPDEVRGVEEFEASFELVASDGFGNWGDTLLTTEPAVVTYPPQIWGEYENAGLTMTIRPRINELVTVETPEEGEAIFIVSETESKEAGGGADGAGELFRILKVTEDEANEMLCYDMSGRVVFASDMDRNFYVIEHPTDVRYDRATVEEMYEDQDQWTMLTEWASEEARDRFMEENWEQLFNEFRGNTTVDMYLNRILYLDDVNYTVSTTEFGPLSPNEEVDPSPYLHAMMNSWFLSTDLEEGPDGEYAVINFPDYDARMDFFFVKDTNVIRVIQGENEEYYEAPYWVDGYGYAYLVQGWYDELAVAEGLKEADDSLDGFIGSWAEKIAGRGYVEISDSMIPGVANIDVNWPESAATMHTWRLVGSLDEEGKLVYTNGQHSVETYDSDGALTDWEDFEGETGCFYLNDAGELCWQNDSDEMDDVSEFIAVDFYEMEDAQ